MDQAAALAMRAYALGYYDGRSTGSEKCPYEPDDWLREHYRLGYEAGVADYCRIDAPDAERDD